MLRLCATARDSLKVNSKSVPPRDKIPDRTMDRHIAELLSAGKIERRGSKKTGGYWILRKDVTTNLH